MTIVSPASFEAITGLPEWLAYVFVFLFGAAIGSFLNVVIHRVPNEESIVFPNSACPKCKTSIKPYDNIPIISWLLLAGKCRNCKEPIAWRYPAVELLTALTFVLIYYRVEFTPYLPVALGFGAVMIALIFIDAGHMILPNVITYPLFILAILIRIAFPLLFTENYFSDLLHAPFASAVGYAPWLVSLCGAVVGACAGGGSLWIVGELWKRLRGVEAMGLGDVKLMLGVGALLGWRLALLSIFLGAFSGAVIGSIMLLKDREKGLQSQIPFGIFLGTGSILAMLFGESLIAWYIRSFLP